jgi:tyrocidine synthetase-3
MIIEKFEKQVEGFPGKLAVKAGEQALTYAELNRRANQVAHEILAINKAAAVNMNTSNTFIVALLFEHGADVIVGIIGTLKANKTYVILDVNYPDKRLSNILEHSEASVILTNRINQPLAESLAVQSAKRMRVITIENIDSETAGDNINRETAGSRPAYILYTSGSTGNPKGVVQNHQNILYFIHHWTQRFSITSADRIALLASLSHDGAVPDIFGALLNGAALYPYDLKERNSITGLAAWLLREKITIWHSVPTLYRYFVRELTGNEGFPHLCLVVLGGEEVKKPDVTMFKTYFPYSSFANIYGQTESTVNSIWLLSRDDPFKRIIIGEPIGETGIFLVDDHKNLVEEIGPGEIVIASEHVAPGYWQDEESSKRVFTRDSELGRLFWTGDLGHLNADGTISIKGRKDFQVKIRGFRVESGEIESILLKHPGVKEAVAIAREDEKGENYLCAYITADTPLSSPALREFLSAELPDYMIPRYFVSLEKMPLIASGKVDRNALPEPDRSAQPTTGYEPPVNEIQEKLIIMWQELLETENIGIHANFFELGGHSILIITLISKIYQIFNVELQLRDVFDYPTIDELSQYIIKSKKTAFSTIEPVETKEYYEATPDQTRMFFLNELEGISTTYNLPEIMKVDGELDGHRLEEIFKELIKRHGSLRTSFQLTNGKVVQRIHSHETIDFSIMYIDARKENRQNDAELKKIIENFIRPFDLKEVPLIRVSLVKLAPAVYLLLQDIHHIISDGISGIILLNNFEKLYNNKKLPGLRLNYRDYSEWQNRLVHSNQIKQQEEYWLNMFAGELPVLNLPTNYPRPGMQSFEGDIIGFRLEEEMSWQLNQLVKETGATIFIVLLAVYYVLLHKYSRQEDIIIGSVINGRNHVDLGNMLGFFVKTLPLRNYPTPGKRFVTFLEEVKTNTIKAFENQLYPLNHLLKKISIKTNPARNPLFDAAFIMIPTTEIISTGEPGSDKGKTINLTSYPFKNKTAMFDLCIMAYEQEGRIAGGFQYCTKLFKREAMELMKERFITLTGEILKNKEKPIRYLDYMLPIEKEMDNPGAVEFDL